jgi:hypothetical protein
MIWGEKNLNTADEAAAKKSGAGILLNFDEPDNLGAQSRWEPTQLGMDQRRALTKFAAKGIFTATVSMAFQVNNRLLSTVYESIGTQVALTVVGVAFLCSADGCSGVKPRIGSTVSNGNEENRSRTGKFAR